MRSFSDSSVKSLLLLCGASFSTLVHGAGAPTATVDAGVLVGKTTSLPDALGPVNQFLGVPFAQSPPERFSPPKSPSHYGKIDASNFKTACLQQFQYPLVASLLVQKIFNYPPLPESEDCLYLNVFAPSTPAPAGGRAVMFWIYGGSLQFGNAALPMYDGSAFAAYEDVIVVTTNYRTNVFGFPSSPELPLKERNLGFLDQRFSLDWVQRNIHAFGGDPNKVTIFGESAGAFSVDSLLTSFPKGSKPPFRAAILESGEFSYRPYPQATPASVLPAWNNLTQALGCPGKYKSDLACVRAAKGTLIQQIVDQKSLTFNPIVDNVTLVKNPAAVRLSGNIANIPVLTGCNSQEGRVFEIGQTDVHAWLETNIGPVAPQLIPAIEAAYPVGKDGLNSGYDVISQIAADLNFVCPQAMSANANAAIGIPTWRFYFNASFANGDRGFPGLGVYHSSEIPLVFRTYDNGGLTTQQYSLSQYIQGAWARFARNPAGGPGWNAVGTGLKGTVLSGATTLVRGGQYKDLAGNVLKGDWNVGVLGDVDNVKGSGVTVLPQSDIDSKCKLYLPIFEALVGPAGIPPTP